MGELLRRATKIMVIRHAEKPSDSHRPSDVTFEGAHEKESLTVRGWQRAGALSALFVPADGRFQDASLARPRFLYASKPVRHDGSRRPLETITPLAEKLGVGINSDFRKTEAADMLREALSREGVVLVCWQREFIPKIANHILGDEATGYFDYGEKLMEAMEKRDDICILRK